MSEDIKRYENNPVLLQSHSWEPLWKCEPILNDKWVLIGVSCSKETYEKYITLLNNYKCQNVLKNFL